MYLDIFPSWGPFYKIARMVINKLPTSYTECSMNQLYFIVEKLCFPIMAQFTNL